MAASIPMELFSLFLAYALFLSGALGRMTCERLDHNTCAFAVSSSGFRCVLEKYVLGTDRAEDYTCRTSGAKATITAGWVESDECIAACGIKRQTFGISSDSLLDRQFMQRLCSPECYLNCPNIIDLYFNIAAEEGTFLSNLCRTNGARREASEKISTANGSEKLGDHILHFTPQPAPGRNKVEFDDDAADGNTSTPTAKKNLIDPRFDENIASAPQIDSHDDDNTSFVPLVNASW